MKAALVIGPISLRSVSISLYAACAFSIVNSPPSSCVIAPISQSPTKSRSLPCPVAG